MESLQDQVVVITMASAGIDRARARELLGATIGSMAQGS